jgi:hypothetical protein
MRADCQGDHASSGEPPPSGLPDPQPVDAASSPGHQHAPRSTIDQGEQADAVWAVQEGAVPGLQPARPSWTNRSGGRWKQATDGERKLPLLR